MDEEGYIKSLREGKILPCFAARKKSLMLISLNVNERQRKFNYKWGLEHKKRPKGG